MLRILCTILILFWSVPGLVASENKPVLLHVKTALSVDDAQLCAVPNVAWAALAKGRPVTIMFDGSAVTSIARGFGWRGWLGLSSTAMERAGLPDRERMALAEQFKVAIDDVPEDYGAYLKLLKAKGARLYYNATMALLYKIPPGSIDEYIEPLQLSALLDVLERESTYLVY